MPIAIALKIKIIANETKRSLGFACINGATAAMAVAPHIAVPDAIKIPIFLSTFKRLANNAPADRTNKTKIEI